MIDPAKATAGPAPTVGRYLVFTRCASSQVSDWVEPTVATWNVGRWHFHDHYHGTREVVGWIGPIPPMKVQTIRERSPSFAPPAQEYDL